jgi:hypothetical protein
MTHHAFIAGMFAVLAAGCPGSTATKPTTTTTTSGEASASPDGTAKPKSGLDKLMRTRMNKAYTQLVFYVLDSTADVDFAKIQAETEDLKGAVGTVLSLPTPAMAQSEEARSVYRTYNETLQRDTNRFAEAVGAKDRPQMEGLLSKIGKTCNDCHRFFRVDVKDPPK